MLVRKRNEFLDDDNSDEELDNCYDSDEVEVGRGAIVRRSSKRRKTDGELSEESFGGPSDAAPEGKTSEDRAAAAVAVGQGQPDPRFTSLEEADEQPQEETTSQITKPALKPSTSKQVATAQRAARKSGVVYISRVPPFMKPQTLKHFLSPHAPKGIGRIFLTPEDHASHVRRVKNGGNKKRSFTDGWVEFTSKREAKAAVEMLNGNIIGGKKGNFYHDDLWNMKYLKGFKWSNLTEQIAAENAERGARLREEFRKTRKENKAFLEDVERGKMLDGMKSKQKAKFQKASGDGVDGDVDKRSGREFRQRKVQGKAGGGAEEGPPKEVSKALSMIFG